MISRKPAITGAMAGVLLMTACQGPQPHQTTGRPDPDTAAGKAGKLAYKVEKETERVAKEADKKIDQAARDARAGYREAQEKH
jgi:hypothetical protein